MKYLLVIQFVFCSLFSLAQDCSMELLLKKPGTWKESSNNSSGIATGDLAKEKKTMAAIHAMIKSNYVPTGVIAEVNSGYNSPQSNVPVNNYVYSIIPLNYYCDGKVIKIVGETPSYFSISVNLFDAEIYESPNKNEVTYGTGYHYITDMPVEKDGCWQFKTKDAPLGFGMTGKSNSWLITYSGKLPFAYVSQKEFLETRKIILANERLQSGSGYRDVLARLEIEKGYKEKEYKGDPEKLKKYMQMDYTDSKTRYEKLLADNEKKYKPAFDKIEAQLKMNSAELNQPAIVKLDPKDPLSYLFTVDDDPLGLVLIKPNPAYFNNKLPRSAPQFFWIYERGDHKDPIPANFMADIRKAVDFSLLKNMLGK